MRIRGMPRSRRKLVVEVEVRVRAGLEERQIKNTVPSQRQFRTVHGESVEFAASNHPAARV